MSSLKVKNLREDVVMEWQAKKHSSAIPLVTAFYDAKQRMWIKITISVVSLEALARKFPSCETAVPNDADFVVLQYVQSLLHNRWNTNLDRKFIVLVLLKYFEPRSTLHITHSLVSVQYSRSCRMSPISTPFNIEPFTYDSESPRSRE